MGRPGRRLRLACLEDLQNDSKKSHQNTAQLLPIWDGGNTRPNSGVNLTLDGA